MREDTEYRGHDILEILHEKFIAQLKALNPKVTFINTLK